MDKLAIFGNEKEYVTRLSECLRTVAGKDMEVILFTEEEAFDEYLKDHKVRICLALDNTDLSERKNIENLIALTEEENVPGKINMYMSCNRIYSEAMALCAEKPETVKAPLSSGRKEIIGIYTPIKRSFQTTFAITLGQVLSRKKKVLYLNFESFSGFETLSGRAAAKDLMDLLYFSECGDPNFSMRVDSLKERIGELDYISPAGAFVKFSLVTKEQWIKLIDTIARETDYETVILDLSENVNGLLDILKRCSLVYTITDSDRVATAKVAQYENMLRDSSYRDILLKTENIVVPKLREIPGSFELLTHSELAGFVKKLVNFDTGGDLHD